MKWRKVSLKTTTKAIDFISALFDELGFEGIAIEDHVPLSEEDKKAMFIDFLPDIQPDDGTAIISSYIELEKDVEQMRKDIEQGLEELSMFTELGECKLSFSIEDDKDWINNWKKYFKSFWVTNNIMIKPTWETMEMVKEDNIVIEIDPGTAFGTGAHETTKLCIQGIEEYLTKDTKLLDVGCGSGILSIIALKLGCDCAVATDIDPIACEVALENAKVNQISNSKFQVIKGNLISDEEIQQKIGTKKYDMIVANILADVIIPLSSVVGKFMKKDAVFISSGIINIKMEEVKEALQNNGFEILKINQLGDWYSFVTKCK